MEKSNRGKHEMKLVGKAFKWFHLCVQRKKGKLFIFHRHCSVECAEKWEDLLQLFLVSLLIFDMEIMLVVKFTIQRRQKTMSSANIAQRQSQVEQDFIRKTSENRNLFNLGSRIYGLLWWWSDGVNNWICYGCIIWHECKKSKATNFNDNRQRDNIAWIAKKN